MDPVYVASHLEWQMNDLGIDYKNGPALAEIVTLLAERCHTLRELAQQSRYFYEEYEEIDAAAAKKHLKAAAREPLALIRTKLAALESWETEPLHHVIQDTATELELGMGKVGMPLRVAVTGLGQSPSIDAVMQLIGKERVLARLDKVLALLPAAE